MEAKFEELQKRQPTKLLPSRKQGSPLLLGVELDTAVKAYVENIDPKTRRRLICTMKPSVALNIFPKNPSLAQLACNSKTTSTICNQSGGNTCPVFMPRHRHWYNYSWSSKTMSSSSATGPEDNVVDSNPLYSSVHTGVHKRKGVRKRKWV